jgi:hypothetical protein
MSEKGSKTEVAPLERHVRSTLKSRHRPANPACPFRARNGRDVSYPIPFPARPTHA